MTEATVLIVGAGTFGTSTAYHLANTYKDPSRVTIIDRWAPSSPTKAAAAIDVNRIIYTDYASPLYCNLANEAIHPWFWSQDLGHFFHKTGIMVLDDQGNDFSERVRHTLQQRGSDYTKNVDVSHTAKQWEVLKGMKTDDVGNSYFNPEAGWADAALATANFMTVAEKKGVKRVVGEVEELLFDVQRQRLLGVRTSDGRRFTADQIVLAAGAWTSSMVAPIEDALRVQAQDRIERQIQAVGRLSVYYTLSAEATDRMCETNMPIIAYRQQAILTPPSLENRTLKINDISTEFVNMVTTKSGHQISVPSNRLQEDVPENLKRKTNNVLQLMIPWFSSEQTPERWRACWDTKTPTGDWLLCKHPHLQLENLFLTAGGNFNSYKSMPIVGKYVCNILKGKSNGAEKDTAWGWKSGETLRDGGRKQELGCRETYGVRPNFEASDSVKFSSRL
ncbi:Putative FAD dependent oxidoreductase, FAD/NAD(P)-binding domain superfamily, MTOX family [Colletotrichum destructivum]|uniref:FAD dependent oxidoreductase, FAD/NAD(P)-binding domain superfamily, MTOX family n=1 Tax=Colletotrichum destructivum TaxID=34406 RepID=A0AAX4IQ29_9PEZI|nr:Putative FAD dependent oxidoreductase, FAD/NAD(P)-binding domain superfamily, MTOX family [Colletotrichum destructivum]